MGVSVVQTHSNRSKNKNVDNSHIYNETVIISKIVILKRLILHSLLSEIRNLVLVRELQENFNAVLFRATTKTKVSVFVCLDPFVIVLFLK